MSDGDEEITVIYPVNIQSQVYWKQTYRIFKTLLQ